MVALLALTTTARAQSTPAQEAQQEEQLGAETPPEGHVTAEPMPPPPVHAPPIEEMQVEEFAVPPPLAARLSWNSEWGRFTFAEYVVTAVAASAALASAIVGPPDNPRTGGILFDEQVRDTFRFGSEVGRRGARDMSDLALSISVSYPFLVDALIVAAWVRDSPDVGVQMALINLETMAIALAVHGVVSNVVGRERPYVRVCGDELDARVDDCAGRNSHQSFFSGHTMQTFTSAALTCMHHMNLPLHGGGVLDAVPCLGGFALAAFTGFMRIAGDQHYASDVIFGATIGSVIGFAVPWLFHYRGHHAPEHFDDVQVLLVPSTNGASVVGVF